jgi:glycogen phosphorylase
MPVGSALAGDFLKTASDLGVPVTGIGLLYSEGCPDRSSTPADGSTRAIRPTIPAPCRSGPARGADGAWLQIPLDLPGRTLFLRLRRAQVGRVSRYLLNANNPLNSPAGRGISGRAALHLNVRPGCGQIATPNPVLAAWHRS